MWKDMSCSTKIHGNDFWVCQAEISMLLKQNLLSEMYGWLCESSECMSLSVQFFQLCVFLAMWTKNNLTKTSLFLIGFNREVK